LREANVRHRRAKPLRARPGLAVVELAVLLPFLCALFVFAVDYARIFYFDLTLVNAARCGAVYGSQNPSTALDTAGIQAAALRDAPNINAQQLTVTSSTSGSNPTMLSVTVSYSFTTITRFPGIPYRINLSRTVQMSVTPLMPG
jgi:Flp pilus assembly protein TadG